MVKKHATLADAVLNYEALEDELCSIKQELWPCLRATATGENNARMGILASTAGAAGVFVWGDFGARENSNWLKIKWFTNDAHGFCCGDCDC